MNPLRTMIQWLLPAPRTPEDIAAKAESQRLRDEMETQRLAQRSASGENFQSGGRMGQ